MRGTVTGLMVIGLIMGVAGAAVAASDNAVRVNIPFAFYAGEQIMPAGEYEFELPNSGTTATGALLKVSSLDRSRCQNLLSWPQAGSTAETDWHVMFSKVGDRYFLSGLRNSQLGAVLAKSSSEKKLARAYGSGTGEPTVIHLKAQTQRSR